MCGIAGAWNPLGVDPGPVTAMVHSLAHRGPDDERVTVLGPAERPWAALGARRLAIVDLRQGAQPVADDSGRFVASMNGELYNHRALHKQLAAQGHRFHGHGDTEVLAHLLASNPRAPERCLERLHGMFALAVADTERRALLLVRDRMGQKPLYWTRLEDGTLLWGSELKALRAHPRLRLQPDRRALQAVLLFEYVPTPWTPWQGIHKLEPGTMLVAEPSGLRIERWWTPPVPQERDDGSTERWAEALRNALQLAVVQRLDADVEIGCLLSGGVDSSTVAALAQARLSRPLRTFSISVDAPGFDEGAQARRVAAHLGTEHRSARLQAADLPRLLDRVTALVDEPLADSSLIPTWRLMELVAEAGLKAVLSGDGADESFAGYPTLQAHRLAPLATPLAPVLAPLVAALPTSREGVTRDYMARRFVAGLGLPWARRHQVWMGAWLPAELSTDEAVWSVVDAHAAAAGGADPASRALYLDQRLYLADGVLVKVDRASMAHGVEVRSPFLDHSIVELAASMGIGHKLRGRQTKRVLKRVARDLLPVEIVDRPKQGFGAPVGPWLAGPCRDLLRGLPEALDDLVPAAVLARVVDEHVDGRADHRRRLWSAVVLARWRQGPWG
ncbi:asparagine synthase (glutamine-hydrolyzing) [Myxococcota bacterium]|nr:asparagine synthase (glutamine-hydrolyzing) [Myxococcota bacterium]